MWKGDDLVQMGTMISSFHLVTLCISLLKGSDHSFAIEINLIDLRTILLLYITSNLDLSHFSHWLCACLPYRICKLGRRPLTPLWEIDWLFIGSIDWFIDWFAELPGDWLWLIRFRALLFESVLFRYGSIIKFKSELAVRSLTQPQLFYSNRFYT